MFAIHSGISRGRFGLAALGTGIGGTRRPLREAQSDRGGGAQTGCADAPAVASGCGLRSVLPDEPASGRLALRNANLSRPLRAANPLSLCWQDSRSVNTPKNSAGEDPLAVQGSLRRARRALDCSGPIGEQDLYEGKGITGTSRLPTTRVAAVSREIPERKKERRIEAGT